MIINENVRFDAVGMGMVQWSNGDLTISGGFRQAGHYGQNRLRLRFAIFGVPEYRALGQEAADAGTVDLIVRYEDDDTPIIEALIDIKIKPAMRRQGFGARALTVIVAACGDDNLKIYDIKKSALGFWHKMGTELTESIRRIDGVIEKEVTLTHHP